MFSKCKIGLSIDCRGMTWKNWNQPGSWHLEGKALALDYTNGVKTAKIDARASARLRHSLMVRPVRDLKRRFR